MFTNFVIVAGMSSTFFFNVEISDVALVKVSLFSSAVLFAASAFFNALLASVAAVVAFSLISVIVEEKLTDCFDQFVPS